ncbi:MAG: hypothetical protein WC836_22915, partial [Desulfobacula sp.]
MEENKANQDEVRIYEISPTEAMSIQEKNIYESQVEMAHKYPRNVRRAMENSIAIVSMSIESAKVCSYSLPRKDSKGNDIQIKGPSVHLARILAQNWGNMKVASRIKEINATQVVSESVCIDLENNLNIAAEVRRSIMGKHGRYNDDMITVTGNACNAISFRNA